MLETLHELAAFLHDREVGGEVGIEHVVEADEAQRRGQTRDGGLPGLHAELFAPGGADGRRDLDEHDLFGIVDGVEHFLGVVAFVQRAHGAVGDALAAQGAVGVFEAIDAGHVDGGLGAGVDHVPDVGVLDLVADLHAAHALDAERKVADERKVGAGPPADVMLFKRRVVDVELVGDALQFAVAAAHARRTMVVVLGEDHAHVGAAGLAGFFAVGVNDHALFDGIVAGREEALVPFHLDDADAAGADLVDAFEETERGDPDPRGLGGVEDRRSFRNLDAFAIDDDVYHFSTRPPLNTP